MKAEAEKLFRQVHTIIEQHQPENDSLLGGGLGLCHYYYTLYQVFGLDEYAEKALDLVEHAANLPDDAAKTLFGPTFSSGGAGMGYVITTLHADGLLDMELTEDLQDLDEYLYQSALDMIQQEGNLDFLHGAAGVIHYFTHRLPDPSVQEKTTNLVKAFLEKTLTTPDGTWFSSFVMDTDDRAEINFSLSHGQTGFMLVLMNAYNKGIRLAEIPPVIESGVNQLLKYRLYPSPEDEVVSLFPSTVKSKTPDQYFVSNRLAWCYGDLNIILLLYNAASFLNKPEWATLANELGARVVLRTTGKETAVSDTHFCHGSSGLVQMYRHLFAISGMKEYETAAEFWLQETLTMLPGELEKNFYAAKETALLEGLVGVNLTLAATLADKPTDWARFLLA